MARYRRKYRSHKRTANYVWQPIAFSETYTNVGSDKVASFNLGTVVPGIGYDTSDIDNIGQAKDAFEFDVTMERIRGTFWHEGKGGAGGLYNSVVPFTMAAVKVPVMFQAQGNDQTSPSINLFDSKAGDDFPVYLSHVCDVGAGSSSTLNEHTLDVKAKRNFEVGDVLRFLLSFMIPSSAGSSVDFDVSLNARILWKLKV